MGAFLMDFATLVRGKEIKWMKALRDVTFASLAFPVGVVSK